jgi:hypothetical protein
MGDRDQSAFEAVARAMAKRAGKVVRPEAPQAPEPPPRPPRSDGGIEWVETPPPKVQTAKDLDRGPPQPVSIYLVLAGSIFLVAAVVFGVVVYSKLPTSEEILHQPYVAMIRQWSECDPTQINSINGEHSQQYLKAFVDNRCSRTLAITQTEIVEASYGSGGSRELWRYLSNERIEPSGGKFITAYLKKRERAPSDWSEEKWSRYRIVRYYVEP